MKDTEIKKSVREGYGENRQRGQFLLQSRAVPHAATALNPPAISARVSDIPKKTLTASRKGPTWGWAAAIP